MFKKLAFSQAVLRAMAKEAGIPLPMVAGAGLAAGAHVVSNGLKKGKEYKAGFAPGVAENRVE
jgi:hypothetical protein